MQQIVYPYPINESKLKGGRFENVEFGDKKYKIKLPEDVRIGSKLRLKGLAGNVDESFRGQDLILLLQKQASTFNTINRDIIIDLPLNLNRHKRGNTKRVHLADKKFDIQIPSISDYGSLLRMRGIAEILNGGYPGDILLRIAEKPDMNKGILHMIYASFVGFDTPPDQRIFKIKFKLPWLFEFDNEFHFRSGDSKLDGKY